MVGRVRDISRTGTAMMLILFLLISFVPPQEQTIQRLRDIRTIYVDKLRDSDDAILVREKIMNRLFELKALAVTDDKDKADAVLVGVVTFSTGFRASGNVARTRHYADFAVRLVTPDKRILWTKAGDSSADHADEAIPDSLLNAIKKDSKEKK
jgi:hypothetical protein